MYLRRFSTRSWSGTVLRGLSDDDRRRPEYFVADDVSILEDGHDHAVAIGLVDRRGTDGFVARGVEWLSQRQEALEGLEWIADNYLSAATPVQTALPELIRIGARIRSSIVTRTRANLAVLIEEISAQRAATVLPAEGGWSAVIRVPRTLSDEDFAATLLRDEGVIVQPGYFFDFAAEGHVVVSLLTPPDVFREGVRRIARRTPS